MRVAIAQPAIAAYAETIDFRAIIAIGIADHDHLIAAHQHFIIPGGTGIVLARGEGVDGIHRGQRIAAVADGEDPAPPQHHQIFARIFHDGAFIDALLLRVGDLLAFGCVGSDGGGIGQRFGGGGRRRRRQRLGSDRDFPCVTPRLGALQLLHLPGEAGEFRLAGEGLQAAAVAFLRGRGGGLQRGDQQRGGNRQAGGTQGVTAKRCHRHSPSRP